MQYLIMTSMFKLIFYILRTGAQSFFDGFRIILLIENSSENPCLWSGLVDGHLYM